MELNILICGIGGQGVVFLGSLLRKCFLELYPKAIIVGTESRGVSQREGSVISTVRVRKTEEFEDVLSPEIPPFGADIVIALEPIELLRNFSTLNERSLIILNNEPIIPKSSVLGITRNVNDKDAENAKKYSNPSWIVKKVQELLLSYPRETTKEEVHLNKYKKEVFVIDNIESFSSLPQVMDLNFSKLILDELGSSTYLNLVMVGFLACIANKWINYDDIENCIKREFQNNNQLIEKNQKALEYGQTLAINYFRFRNST